MDSIKNEMLDYLCKVRATLIFRPSSSKFGCEATIFSMAYNRYLNHEEGVTFEDVISSTVDLVDALIEFLETKV